MAAVGLDPVAGDVSGLLGATGTSTVTRSRRSGPVRAAGARASSRIHSRRLASMDRATLARGYGMRGHRGSISDEAVREGVFPVAARERAIRR